MIYAATTDDGTEVWIVNDGQTKRRFGTREEAMMATQTPVAAEWEAELRADVEQARALILRVQGLSLLAQTNDISSVIAATEAGQVLAGTSITKEDAERVATLFADLEAWLQEPVSGEGQQPPRLAVLFRRF